MGVALFSRDGHVFLGKRATKGVVPAYSWQMPQGGVDGDEAPEDAALRELYEETSIKSASHLAAIDGWLHYDLPPEIAAWRGRYRGQAQRWFALRFEGDESEINVKRPAGGHPAEFSTWEWATLERTPELVVPFKREVYEYVVDAFKPYAA